MFTGIIEALGSVRSRSTEGTNVTFAIESAISKAFHEDQSVNHNGVCLTVTRVEGDTHFVTAVHETLVKSNLSSLHQGDKVNLERSLLNNGRFDGHIVQGHVDQTATCTGIKDENGSWLYDFEYDPSVGNVTVEKGSVSINGTSLTCYNSKENGFRVAIIPYTFEHTNFHQLTVGSVVNLEFDVIGKYVKKLLRM